MTKEQAIEALKTAYDSHGEEGYHIDADKVLCDFLTALEYADVVAEYEKGSKWYA